MENKDSKQMNQSLQNGTEQSSLDASKIKNISSLESNATITETPKATVIKIEKADIQLVADEYDITTEQAELALKENKGDLISTLKSLLKK